ncbi:MAG: FAD-dependent oxidoreductase, partial [Lentisphaeria bacterium]|nr:FAD-dependent oxidoreductase [Lentisphaeria bacterium]
GGCNSSEIRVGLGGFPHYPPYANLGRTVDAVAPVFGSGKALAAECYEDARKLNAFRLCDWRLCRVVLEQRVVTVETDPADPSLIAAVVARSTRTGGDVRYKARLFADCTGDATLARGAGAAYMYGTEGREVFGETLAPAKTRKEVMGLSSQWYSSDKAEPTSFPEVDWGLHFTDATCYYVTCGDWEAETGQFRDQIREAEYVRDYSLMTLYSNWSYLKNHSARKEEWARKSIDWVSPCGGKRESCRVYGDHVLTQQDLECGIDHPDFTGTVTWSIDLHYPDPENVAKFAEPFRSCAYHRMISGSPVPYRCLYARDVRNLFLGGRIISTSHVAFSAVRVMRTLGVLGEVVGLAASICREENAYPREVYEKHLDRLKAMMEQGVPIEVPHNGGHPGQKQECYHFKELGFFWFRPDGVRDPKNIPEGAMNRMKALKIQTIYTDLDQI